MDRIINALRREPVRARLYSIAAAALAVLVYYDVLELDAAPLWLSVVGSIFAVEGTRSQVVPVVKGGARKR